MSAPEGPAELVTRAYEAFARRDLDAVRALLAPDVVVSTRVETAEGIESVMDLLRGFDVVFDGYAITVESLTEHGDSVVAAVHHRGRGQGSGLGVDLRNFHVWTVRGGRITSMRAVISAAEAEELAGA